MDRDVEVDSLDAIRAIIHNSQEVLEQRLMDEPSYHASSFGAGGRISQIVDPEFRPPSHQMTQVQHMPPAHLRPFGHSVDHTVGSPQPISINLPNNGPGVMAGGYSNMPNYGANHPGLPTNHLSVPTCSIAFSIPTQATTFSDLASQRMANTILTGSHTNFSGASNHGSAGGLGFYQQTDHVISSTLHDYGPPSAANNYPNLTGPNNSGYQNVQSSQPSNIVTIGFHVPTSTMSNENRNSYSDPISNRLREPGRMVVGAPPDLNYRSTNASPSVSSAQRGNETRTSSAQNDSASTTTAPIYSKPNKEKEGPVYSPPPPPPPVESNEISPPPPPPQSSSPPLDSVNITTASLTSIITSTITTTVASAATSAITSTTAQSSSSGLTSSSNRIPKKTLSNTDRFDEMTLIDLQKKYRQYEDELKAINIKRESIERTLNDMTRRSKGKNIELDPMFRQKKEEQTECATTHGELTSKLKKIQDKLGSKFGYKMREAARRPGNHALTSRMSTSGPSRREEPPPRPKDQSNLMLNLVVKETWCQSCDIHFDSLAEYCKHLHDREHTRKFKTSTPWRSTKELLDTRKTYDMMKSICSKLEHELDRVFTIKDLDRAMNPLLECKEKEKVLKEKVLSRERGKFDNNDNLFKAKGYDYLLPITGFYCKLCQKALCDATDVEQHMKSYEHNYTHAKSVALNSSHETNFRAQLEKSYKRQYKPTVMPYKKATSHIVDEHESVADKFSKKPDPQAEAKSDKRPPTTTTAAKKKRSAGDSDSETDLRPNDKIKRTANVPEIVPIARRSQPAALKQLKRTKEPVRKESSSSSETEDEDEIIANADADKNYLPVIGCDKDKEKEKEKEKETETETEKSPKEDAGDGTNDTDYNDPPEVLGSAMMEPGDENSPFPELELRVTGNLHVSALEDWRLAASCKVKLQRVNLDDYKDQLLDSTTLMSRVYRLVAKKETYKLPDLFIGHETKPTFFTKTGNVIPVDLDKNKKDGDEEKEKKPKIDKQSVKDTEEDDNTSNQRPKFDMKFLEDFLCGP